MMSSNTVERSTPQDFFDKLNDEFHFDIDVCANHMNNKCKKYFTKDTNWLCIKWDWVCWMNPPYWREIGKRVRKASEESRRCNTIVVCLLPARTDTKRFHDYIYLRAEIRFIKGRLKFWGSKNSAPFPSMVVVFK